MTDKDIMSDFTGKMEAILYRMETERQSTEKQLELYCDTIDKTISHYDDRMAANDARWTALRNTVWTFISIVAIAIFTGGATIVNKPSKKEVEEIIKSEDHIGTDAVLRGFGAVTDDVYNTFEQMDEMTHEQAKDLKEDARMHVIREVDPSYRTRNIEQVK